MGLCVYMEILTECRNEFLEMSIFVKISAEISKIIFKFALIYKNHPGAHTPAQSRLVVFEYLIVNVPFQGVTKHPYSPKQFFLPLEVKQM